MKTKKTSTDAHTHVPPSLLSLLSPPLPGWLSLALPSWIPGALLACLLAACGGGGGSSAPEPGPVQALSASQPGEMMTEVRERVRARAAAGVQYDYIGTATDVMLTVATTASTPAATSTRSAPLSSEAGVDEADLIQSDGQRIYTLQPIGSDALSLGVYTRAADGHAQRQASLKLAPPAPAGPISSDGMHLAANGKALAVLGRRWVALGLPPGCVGICPTFAPNWVRPSVVVQRVDVSASTPVLSDEISIDGQLVDSRRIGDLLYLVTVHRPALPTDLLPASATAEQREAAIRQMSAADVLPSVRRGTAAATPLLSDTDCYLPQQNPSLAVEVTSISVFDLRSGTLLPRSRCVMAASDALYLTGTSLYLASPVQMVIADANQLMIYPTGARTELHKFALADGSLVYRGSGTVEGHLGWDPQRKPHRLSEHQGVLRVLSYTGQTGWFGEVADGPRAGTPSPARVTLLREGTAAGGRPELQVLATLPNANRPAPLGKAGEQVYGVRFVGDRGYLVTFRRTDPLYVLDLSVPTDPRTLGELEVNGYSEDLYPLPQGLLLGVGRDADELGRVTGLKVALLDVADGTKPRQLASARLGGSFSRSALDSSRMGLNLLQVGSQVRAALPVSLYESPSGNSLAPVWRNGLQKLEVDTAARTLRIGGLLPSVATMDDYGSLAYERSLQIDDHVYYLRQDTLTGAAW